MTASDLAKYETRGNPDLDTPLTAADHKRQRTAEQIAEHVRSPEVAQDYERQRAEAAAEGKVLAIENPEVLERIAGILASAERNAREHPETMMRWRLRLFCGHSVERTAHGSHTTIHGAFTLSACPECGLDPATIVAARALGPLGKPTHEPAASVSVSVLRHAPSATSSSVL